jgi:hypothetical protein
MNCLQSLVDTHSSNGLESSEAWQLNVVLRCRRCGRLVSRIRAGTATVDEKKCSPHFDGSDAIKCRELALGRTHVVPVGSVKRIVGLPLDSSKDQTAYKSVASRHDMTLVGRSRSVDNLTQCCRGFQLTV